jgi:hypothetical protein
MSMTESTSITTAETSSGLFAEAVGGIATIVLAVLALSGVSPEYLLAIGTIVFGAALLIEGTSMATNYVHVLSASTIGEGLPTGVNGLSAVFLGGVSGIILGVLALLGIAPNILVSASIIVFGSALILSSSAMVNLNAMKLRMAGQMSGRENMVAAVGSLGVGAAGAQVLSGVAAIVLGILALAGLGAAAGGAAAGAAAAGAAATHPGVMLDLVALLVIGAAILLTGNGMNNAVLGIFQSPRRSFVSR